MDCGQLTPEDIVECQRVLTVGGILRDVVGRQQRERRVERVVLGAVVNNVILTVKQQPQREHNSNSLNPSAGDRRTPERPEWQDTTDTATTEASEKVSWQNG